MRENESNFQRTAYLRRPQIEDVQFGLRRRFGCFWADLELSQEQRPRDSGPPAAQNDN